MKVKLLNYTPNLETVIAERAGICYDNETNDTKKLIRRLKLNKHLATFRFAHVTFQISEFSRSCSMQILRHAFLDYLQRSQRYVKEFGFEYVVPPSIKSHSDKDVPEIFRQAMIVADSAYRDLMEAGVKAEDARYVLPNACYTKMNITGSVQAWYDFLRGSGAGRLQDAAQWEIKEIACLIDKELHVIAPNIFDGDCVYRPH